MKVFHFKEADSLSDFQTFIQEIYGLPDDRLFSIHDLLVNQQRFTMRALKGIRKEDLKKLKLNLAIAFAWLSAVANRLHIDLEANVWRRFPGSCSYCGKSPCVCKKTKPTKRIKIIRKTAQKPKTLADFQAMFETIYPSSARSLADAGVHLAEEMGEVSEAIHSFLGEHKNYQLEEAQQELADFVSCVFGVANSAKLDVSRELAKMFDNNCHVCHKAPCICNFSSVVKFKS